MRGGLQVLFNFLLIECLFVHPSAVDDDSRLGRYTAEQVRVFLSKLTPSLGRVDLQQVATAEHNGSDLDLQVSKIYPQVNEGQFEVDMAFAEQPEGLRRGQTLQTRLTLGDNTDATLIPNGAFYQETGGNWVFVVAPGGGEAVKRSVRLGRRNTKFIEVLDGLEPGERVITSPYTSFVGMDRLNLDE